MPIASAQPNEKPWPGLGVRTEVLVLPNVSGEAVETLAAIDSGRPDTYVPSAHDNAAQTPPVSASSAQPSFVTSPPMPSQQQEDAYSSPSRPSIMSRGRVSRRGDDSGSDNGYSYGYDTTGKCAILQLP
jgi:hypothetical protein